MRILIDIAHPAHVHYFRNFLKIMEMKGHSCLMTLRDRDPIVDLVTHYNLPHEMRTLKEDEKGTKLKYALTAIKNIYKISKRFNPDLFIDMGTVFASPIAKMMGKPYLAFDDTEASVKARFLHMPFTNYILTPSSFSIDLGEKQIYFNGLMELCYLHENRYAPNPKILSILGIKNNDKYVIVRFVSWNAHHDIGHSGLSLDMKRKAVKGISEYAKVFISSEKELPQALKHYQIKIPPERMHDALAYATMLYGESATMASECAVLGTPAIYLDNEGRGYTDEEEEKYGLVFNFTESMEDQELSIRKSVELLKTADIKQSWQKKREKMLSEKIDVTAFMVWFIENYPNSARIVMEDPDYQYRFR